MPSKRAILADYAKAYNLKTFVETGTCDGGTLAAMIPLCDKLYSIELDDEIYGVAAERFAPFPSVTMIHGDSSTKLPNLLALIDQPTLFWLDAHDADYKGPIVTEVLSIFRSTAKGVILVDDADYINKAIPAQDGDWLLENKDFGIIRIIHKSLQSDRKGEQHEVSKESNPQGVEAA